MPRLCPRHGARQSRAPRAKLARRTSRLAPPLHPRGALAHYPGGAIGTSRPTAITPANFAWYYPHDAVRPLAAPHRHAPRSCPVAVGRDVPIAPPCPVAAPHRPHPVAARHSPVAARHGRHPVRQDSLSFNVSATAERTLSGDMECRQIPDFKPHERLWHGQHDGSPVACKTVCELP